MERSPALFLVRVFRLIKRSHVRIQRFYGNNGFLIVANFLISAIMKERSREFAHRVINAKSI